MTLRHLPLIVCKLNLTRLSVCAAVFATLCLTGCQTTTRRVVPDEGNPEEVRLALQAPDDLHDISGYLLRYHITHRALPDQLETLRTTSVMPVAGYDRLNEYAYHREGLGTLADGRVIIVVDASIRIEGHAWCILQSPSQNHRSIVLNTVLVPMDDLQRAARRGR